MRIRIAGSAVTKEEQLEIARLLVKAGYQVSVTKGKTVNNKSTIYINFEEVRDDGRNV